MSKTLLDILRERVVIFDGAMGTSLEKLGLTSKDFEGKDGCNEYLVVSKPDAIRSVHEGYLEAGCDAIETDTFGANRIVLAEYGLASRAFELNEKAARLARECAQKYSTPTQPRLVVGSVGPGSKLPSLGHIHFDELKEATKEQIFGLIQGGVDAILIETAQDLLQVKAAVIAATECFDETKKKLPLIAQVTFETTGTMLLGTEMSAVIATFESLPVDVIGMNCATGPREMMEHLKVLSENTTRYISALPNAGMPENIGGKSHYKLTPDEFAHFHEIFVRDLGVSIIGGCCGTTKEHLEAVVKKLKGTVPRKREVRAAHKAASLYSAVAYDQDPRPFLIGEQTNANGSKRFRETLAQDDYEGLTAIARKTAKEGAHMLDVCVAFVGRDEAKDVRETILRYNQHVTAALMIDSTDARVIEEALKLVAGKPIINSINLENGKKRLEEICPLAVKYGAGLVALTIDEEGMAKTREKKFEIAKRIYNLAIGEFGVSSEELFFDALTFTIGSGDESYRAAAQETLEAIRLIKAKLPGARTVLGVSNVSFGLESSSRHVLNSVFLHEAIEAGLDGAIVNVKTIKPLFKIPPEEIELSKNLIYNRWHEGKDPLKEFIIHFSKKKTPLETEARPRLALSIEDALKQRIIDGDTELLEQDLDKAREKYPPLEIINNFLLEGMKTVGELFGEGKTQLPFVLQSAEVMKRAVTHLEKFMNKNETITKGTIVLATVRDDVHDIGKNLADIILTNNGYRVINLGIKQPLETILRAAEEHKADAIGLSGLLVKSTHIMMQYLEEMNQLGVATPVLCGGAALTRKFVEEDLQRIYQGKVYYSADAFSGLKIMNEIMKAKIRYSEEPAHTTSDEASGSLAYARDDGRGGERDDKMVGGGEGKKSAIRHNNPVPRAPFFDTKVLKKIRLEDIFQWIDKVVLFKSQWKFRQGEISDEEYKKLLLDRIEPLYLELTAKCFREKLLEPQAVYGYFPCYSEGNDLVVLDAAAKKERARFNFPRQKDEPFYCLADFFKPKSADGFDVAVFQAVTVGKRASEYLARLFKNDKYSEYLYIHGLAVAAAEAMAEYLHAQIRAELGINAQDSLVREEIFMKEYQGCRFSLGFSACPNLEDQKKVLELLGAERIGLTLTGESLLVPEQSTTAIILHHPDAKYFNI